MEKNNYCEMFINGHSVKYDHDKEMSFEVWNLDVDKANKTIKEYVDKYDDYATVIIKLLENHPALLLHFAGIGYKDLEKKVVKDFIKAVKK